MVEPRDQNEPAAQADDQAAGKEPGRGGEPAMSGSIEALLKERMRLDEELSRTYSRRITVMFTDIKGSTSFFERRGDIEGRIMVERHNSLLFPIIEAHGGAVIKTIGDAIMAKFEQAEQAVLAAMAMQRRLAEDNRQRETRDQIHIRVGVNTGLGIVEKNDVFGDVVNVAARVESLCDPDQILLSAATFAEVRNSEDIICRAHKEATVRGKEEALKVYRVLWAPEEELLVTSERTRG
ncbi:MAG: adenylate/guanylate cyclase domain-containing protein, partial [Candidatus Tectomicrobia bacterium]|nr:adenylate/guanylate cyclase domain-containing protein [Candidatus Tectomicrobia bacterium]